METYRTIYRLIYYTGQKQAAGIGVIVIVVLTLLSGDLASNAIPYGTLWVLFCGSMRLAVLVLPRPASAAAGYVPGEKPLPKAALAVSITDPCPPEGCPDRDEMTAALPEHVRALIR